ncbi:MAG: hypothetical protein V4687_03145 [Bacteroidota bacterium]
MEQSPQVQDFQLLLEVFREGLKLGLISREEIVLWADNIIANADEPEYFFIEASLSQDINGLIELLNRYVTTSDNPICYRVLFGLIFQRRPIQDINELEKITILLGSMSSWDRLTSFENRTIYMFDDYYLYYSPDLKQLLVELTNFLNLYEAFTLENYKEWNDINLQVLELLKQEDIQANLVNEPLREACEYKEEIQVNIPTESLKEAYVKKEKKQKLKLYFQKLCAMLLLLVFFSLMIALLDDGKTKQLTLYFLLAYCCMILGYGWWNRKSN